MKGSKSHEVEADVPAAELWKIYGTVRFVELVHQLLPQILYQVEVVRGHGGVGTVIKVTLPPGTPGRHSYKEEFVKIDNENRVKEAAVIEGDILELGFNTYVTRFEIVEKGPIAPRSSDRLLSMSTMTGAPSLRPRRGLHLWLRLRRGLSSMSRSRRRPLRQASEFF
ncbi:unnamed protein product [Urochloa humidicola]